MTTVCRESNKWKFSSSLLNASHAIEVNLSGIVQVVLSSESKLNDPPSSSSSVPKYKGLVSVMLKRGGGGSRGKEWRVNIMNRFDFNFLLVGGDEGEFLKLDVGCWML